METEATTTTTIATTPPGGRRPRRRSRYRWRLRWGRPLPWPTRVEILATLGLWLGGMWGWGHWENSLPSLLPPPAAAPNPAGRAVAAAVPPALLLTAERPDADGLFAFGQDRLAVRVPVALRQTSRQGTRPDLSSARGLDADGLRFELTRVFDPRAHSADAADLAHDQAAAICRAAGAVLLDAADDPWVVTGTEESAVHTVLHARLANGKGLTVEGLTFNDPAGPVAWTLWAGYPSDNRRAAALVRASFASAALRPLTPDAPRGDLN